MFFECRTGHLAVALGVSMLVLGSLPARAADSQYEGITVSGDINVVTRIVDFADLNLASPAGQQMLRHRLNVAARQVCIEVTGGNEVTSDRMLSCHRASMTDALARAEVVTAAAKSRSVFAMEAPRPAP